MLYYLRLVLSVSVVYFLLSSCKEEEKTPPPAEVGVIKPVKKQYMADFQIVRFCFQMGLLSCNTTQNPKPISKFSGQESFWTYLFQSS